MLKNTKKIILIKLGNDSRPAGQADIDELKTSLEEKIKDGNETITFITHHAVEIEVIDLEKEFNNE